MPVDLTWNLVKRQALSLCHCAINYPPDNIKTTSTHIPFVTTVL